MKKLILLFLLTSFSYLTLAQEGFEEFTEKKKDWGFSLTPYALLASQSTDVGGKKLRQSFSDLSSLTNAGFQLIGAVRYKRWGLSFDGTFANLGQESPDPPLPLDISIKQRILDFRLRYTLVETFAFKETEVLRGWSLSVNAGPKYWGNTIGVDYAVVIGDRVLDEGSILEEQNWTDLMLGIRSQFVISSKFLVSVEGSIGGFGMGNSSDFSSDFSYFNSYKISKHILINAGFRSFRYSRTDESDSGDLKTKVKVLGPVLGVSFVY